MIKLRSRLDLKHTFDNIKFYTPRILLHHLKACGINCIDKSNIESYIKLVENNIIQYVYVTEPVKNLKYRKDLINYLTTSTKDVLVTPIIIINKCYMFDFDETDYNVNIFVNKEDMFLVEMYKGQWFP